MPSAQPTSPLDPQTYLEWEKTQAEKHEYLNGEVFAMVGARDAFEGEATVEFQSVQVSVALPALFEDVGGAA